MSTPFLNIFNNFSARSSYFRPSPQGQYRGGLSKKEFPLLPCFKPVDLCVL